MMLRMSLFTRRQDMAPAEFRRYWQEVHAPIAVRIPTLQRYEQNLVLAPIAGLAGSGPVPAFDGVCKLAFEDATSMQNVLTPEMTRALREDEAQFIEGLRTTVVEAKVAVPLRAGTAQAHKLILLVERRTGSSEQDFERGWSGAFAQQVRTLKGLRGYTQNFVRSRTVERRPVPRSEWPIDCIDELWFADEASTAAALPQLLRQARPFTASVSGAGVRVHAPEIPALASGTGDRPEASSR